MKSEIKVITQRDKLFILFSFSWLLPSRQFCLKKGLFKFLIVWRVGGKNFFSIPFSTYVSINFVTQNMNLIVKVRFTFDVPSRNTEHKKGNKKVKHKT